MNRFNTGGQSLKVFAQIMVSEDGAVQVECIFHKIKALQKYYEKKMAIISFYS